MNVHRSEFLQSWNNRSEANYSGSVLSYDEQFCSLFESPPHVVIACFVWLLRPAVEHLGRVEAAGTLMHGGKMKINDCYCVGDDSQPDVHVLFRAPLQYVVMSTMRGRESEWRKVPRR